MVVVVVVVVVYTRVVCTLPGTDRLTPTPLLTHHQPEVRGHYIARIFWTDQLSGLWWNVLYQVGPSPSPTVRVEREESPA